MVNMTCFCYTSLIMTNKPSLLRQLMGAAIGSVVALALYYSFKVASPMVTAYVTLPPAERQNDLGDVRVNGEVSPDTLKRMESRNERLADSIELNQPEPEVTDDDWKKAWPTSLPKQTDLIEKPAPLEPIVEKKDGWEDFLRDAAPEKAAAKSEPEVAQLHSGAPALPDSGLGVVALAVSAIGAATGAKVQSRKKKV